MTVQLYNTADRRVSDFIPIIPGQVSLYCCGPTVYNFAHIGNLRTYIFEDILRRVLEFAGYQVNHVMNVTDVGHLTSDGDDGEDKMIRGARERGMTVWDIAEHFTQAFFKDTAALNILRPSIVCRATEHIQYMIDMVQSLEKAGMAYVSGGNVYFDTARFPSYGKMALLDKQDQQAGVTVKVDPNKKSPRDFVLWFTKGKFEDQAMVWPSPWGVGYPGWHIECSAMSTHYLGRRFDIHCGGVDHIPVHHTNEIAQSEGYTGEKWVNYWVHGEFLLLSKEKMSKSSGEFLTLEVLMSKGYEALDYRYFCLGGHYRSQLAFTLESLDGARNARRTLNERVLWLKSQGPAVTLTALGLSWRERFQTAVCNDLNMPQALAVLWGLLKEKDIPDGEKLTLIYEMDRVFGLGLENLEVKNEEIPQDILDLAAKRLEARKNKDWKTSDMVRDQLKALGWVVEDGPAGSRIKRI